MLMNPQQINLLQTYIDAQLVTLSEAQRRLSLFLELEKKDDNFSESCVSSFKEQYLNNILGVTLPAATESPKKFSALRPYFLGLINENDLQQLDNGLKKAISRLSRVSDFLLQSEIQQDVEFKERIQLLAKFWHEDAKLMSRRLQEELLCRANPPVARATIKKYWTTPLETAFSQIYNRIYEDIAKSAPLAISTGLRLQFEYNEVLNDWTYSVGDGNIPSNRQPLLEWVCGLMKKVDVILQHNKKYADLPQYSALHSLRDDCEYMNLKLGFYEDTQKISEQMDLLIGLYQRTKKMKTGVTPLLTVIDEIVALEDKERARRLFVSQTYGDACVNLERHYKEMGRNVRLQFFQHARARLGLEKEERIAREDVVMDYGQFVSDYWKEFTRDLAIIRNRLQSKVVSKQADKSRFYVEESLLNALSSKNRVTLKLILDPIGSSSIKHSDGKHFLEGLCELDSRSEIESNEHIKCTIYYGESDESVVIVLANAHGRKANKNDDCLQYDTVKNIIDILITMGFIRDNLSQPSLSGAASFRI